MRPSQIFVGVLLFLGLFNGGTLFLDSLYSNHGIKDNTTIEVSDEYDQMQREIAGKSNNNSLYNKLRTLNTPEAGIADKIAGGLLLVPDFIGVLLSPIQVVEATLDGLSAEFSYLPGWLFALIRILFYSTLLYAVFSLAVGIRS